jgi:hypothetical protein
MDIHQTYPNITRDFLNTEYFTENKSKARICKEQNISVYNLDKFFNEYGIILKPMGSHLITSIEDKIKLILEQHPYVTFEFIYNEYVNLEKSLPEIHKEYNLNYEQTLKLLEYYKIPKRSISQSKKTETFKIKIHTTLNEKYGVSNISQIKDVKTKKANKCLDQYGVDNFFKRNDFKKIKNEGYIKRYGVDCSDWKSQCSREVWNRKTEDERQEWLSNSILSDSACLKVRTGYKESKAENKISDLLCLLEIQHTRQYPIKYKVDNKLKRYFYDFYIPEINLIIEYNGDYWHANPEIYKSNDLIKYPGREQLASDRWLKDKHKENIAIENKHNIITIWESEIKSISKPDIISLIEQKINNYIK